jgi:outer membrane protein TolC
VWVPTVADAERLPRLSPPDVSPIQQAAWQSDAKSSGAEELPAPSNTDADPFASMKELTADVLVEHVLARNPTLAQMRAVQEAASARYPQVFSLDDPTLSVTIGPATYGSNTVNPAQRVMYSQRYPFPGKRRLRGEQAQAEARAVGDDVDTTRLDLIQAAKDALYDYYQVTRALEVNAANLKLLREFRDNAFARFRTAAGMANEQDIFLADVEISGAQEQQIKLERVRPVAVARLNTLLNRPAALPLPPPPERLGLNRTLPEPQPLQEAALNARPELQALANRLAADQAALALAYKDFYPDLQPFAMYDRFMGNNSQTLPLAFMLGLEVNLPVRRDRRQAAVQEAQAHIARRQAQLQEERNKVSFEVQQAYEQVKESERAVRLYEDTYLSAAKKNVGAAKTAYIAGKIPFLTLIEAERKLIGLQDRYFEAIADYHRRWASLDRVTGARAERAAR